MIDVILEGGPQDGALVVVEPPCRAEGSCCSGGGYGSECNCRLEPLIFRTRMDAALLLLELGCPEVRHGRAVLDRGVQVSAYLDSGKCDELGRRIMYSLEIQ